MDSFDNDLSATLTRCSVLDDYLLDTSRRLVPRTHYSLSKSASLTWSSASPLQFATRARSPYSSTPAYAERFPNVRYSYNYAENKAEDILSKSQPTSVGGTIPRHYYAIKEPVIHTPRRDTSWKYRDMSDNRGLDSTLSLYQATLRSSPSYGNLYHKPRISTFTSKGYYDTERAVSDYHYFSVYGRYMNTAKYWHHPSYWRQRRESEQSRSLDLSRQGYSYWQRYDRRR